MGPGKSVIMRKERVVREQGGSGSGEPKMAAKGLAPREKDGQETSLGDHGSSRTARHEKRCTGSRDGRKGVERGMRPKASNAQAAKPRLRSQQQATEVQMKKHAGMKANQYLYNKTLQACVQDAKMEKRIQRNTGTGSCSQMQRQHASCRKQKGKENWACSVVRLLVCCAFACCRKRRVAAPKIIN